MAWAFKSAARSMFVTSFTTALAFFCNASSTIAPIRIFGYATARGVPHSSSRDTHFFRLAHSIFCGTLILVNYGMVITMFPAVVSLWGKYFENKCLDAKLKKVCCFLSRELTRLLTCLSSRTPSTMLLSSRHPKRRLRRSARRSSRCGFWNDSFTSRFLSYSFERCFPTHLVAL